MRRIVQHGLARLAVCRIGREIGAGVRIRIGQREAAARDLEPDPVSALKGMADVTQANIELEGFVGPENFRLLEPTVVAGASDPANMRQAHGAPVRMNIE
jgi:hypothetical protein